METRRKIPQRRIVAGLGALPAEVDAPKLPQAGTPVKDTGQAAAGLDTQLPALLNRAFQGEL
jgi:hypothetical protein